MKSTKLFSGLALLCLLALTFWVGCKKDDCEPGEDCSTHDSELITKVAVAFSDSATGLAAFEAVFEDADGTGGNSPSIDTMPFAANTTYNASIKVYSTEGGQQVEITSEILAENDEHLFCFTPSGVALTILRTDSDGNFPVGQTSRWNAGVAGQGSVRVVLRHQPDGQKDGTCTPGETDVEIDFPVRIQ